MKAIEKDPAARHKTWLEFGKELSQAFTTLRLSGASVSDSEKFNDLRDMPFFEDFDDVALWEVVRIGSWKTLAAGTVIIREDRKSTRLNSSHLGISYAVFCLKKKKKN